MIYMVVGDGNKMILVSEYVSDAKKCGLNRTRWMLSRVPRGTCGDVAVG